MGEYVNLGRSYVFFLEVSDLYLCVRCCCFAYFLNLF